jgi:oligopeptide transport system ATP-binding protein
MSETVLNVKNLSTYFDIPAGVLKAVDGVSFTVDAGECLGIIGESGSGKTVTCLSVMGLIEQPGRIASGEILFEGQDLRTLSDKALEELRGSQISMVFQDPLTTLNPVFTVERQMTDVIRRHLHLSRREARERACETLRQVGVPEAKDRIRQYPFQLSGGLRQRVVIAMALSCNPRLIIADEPTTALDVSIQAQILDLLQELKTRFNFAMIFVSHDLGIVANLSDKVVIMYAGKLLEMAPTEKIFTAPKHPYTIGLLNSAPSLTSSRQNPLEPIAGVLPDLTDLPPGCPFAPRCEHREADCDQAMPSLEQQDGEHWFACYHPIHHNGRD